MELSGFFIFVTAFSLAVASPGPATATLMAHCLGNGLKGAPQLIFGLLIGDLVWLTFAVLGLAAIANTFASAFLIIKLAGAAYLLYLAYRLWTAEAQPLDMQSSQQKNSWQLFVAGVLVNISNPKAGAFYLALLPTIVDLSTLSFWGYFELVILISVILTGICGAYAYLSAKARRFVTDAAKVRVINRVTGTALGAAALVVATR